MKVILRDEPREILYSALSHSDIKETGGVLVGRIINMNTLEIVSASSQPEGSFSFFLRRWGIREKFGLIKLIKVQNSIYETVNYCGEWHSHPSFSLIPSQQDLKSMWELCLDKKVGANFLILLLTKLDNNNVRCMCYYFHKHYFPECKKVDIEYGGNKI